MSVVLSNACVLIELRFYGIGNESGSWGFIGKLEIEIDGWVEIDIAFSKKYFNFITPLRLSKRHLNWITIRQFRISQNTSYNFFSSFYVLYERNLWVWSLLHLLYHLCICSRSEESLEWGKFVMVYTALYSTPNEIYTFYFWSLTTQSNLIYLT